MSPIVIIATHQRYNITMANIRSIMPYTVVLVVTDINEAELYRSANPGNVIVVVSSNDPLGLKWQLGVDVARQIPHSHIVITGSDDILRKGYISTWSKASTDFIGLRRWYILHDKELHLVEYTAPDHLPLGGGRIYSKALLERMDYCIFDKGKSKCLDDFGWHQAQKSKYALLWYPEILAVKGNWPVMNKVDLKHRNIKLIETFTAGRAQQIITENFNYDCSGVL